MLSLLLLLDFLLNMPASSLDFGVMVSFTSCSSWSQYSVLCGILFGNSELHDSNECNKSWIMSAATAEHTCRCLTTLRKSCRNTTFLTIGLDKNSMWFVVWINVFLPVCRFQKAIKKVRATQRMRRNRGFAFSQTENGRQDQAKIIRAYDTSQTSARPSGY